MYYIKCFPDAYLVKKNPTPVFFLGTHALARFNFRISVYNEVKKDNSFYFNDTGCENVHISCCYYHFSHTNFIVSLFYLKKKR